MNSVILFSAEKFNTQTFEQIAKLKHLGIGVEEVASFKNQDHHDMHTEYTAPVKNTRDRKILKVGSNTASTPHLGGKLMPTFSSESRPNGFDQEVKEFNIGAILQTQP